MSLVFDDIIEAVMDAPTDKSWETVHSPIEPPIYIFKTDVRIRIESPRHGVDREGDEFFEEWMSHLPNKSGSKSIYYLYFNSTILKKVMLVSVDGGRAEVPIPKAKDNLQIKSSFDLKIAQIVDGGQLNSYLDRLNLTI